MNQILEYIVTHYAWFLGGAILVLLAIIGYYADKTNFGQGKNIGSEKDKSKDITNMRLSEAIGEEQIKKGEEKKDEVVESAVLEANKNEENPIQVVEEDSQKIEDVSKLEVDASNKKKFDEKEDFIESASDNIVAAQKSKEKTAEEVALEKFNEEFDLVLPKKDVIAADLLNDIDELSLERTQKINLAELPDLDDIELPKIKNLVNEEQDIWKF